MKYRLEGGEEFPALFLLGSDERDVFTVSLGLSGRSREE
jgi:hypothetical protein